MDLLLDPSAWASLLTLTVLEIILGVDNIVVLAILSNALPKPDAQRARSIGLGLALGLRLILLSAISWMTRLTAPVFSLAGEQFSWRDLILIGGGLFLMVKAIQEIHAEIEGGGSGPSSGPRVKASFRAVISQIAVMDLIFSLDSIITAVGLARDIEVMAAAICIAVAIMYFAAEPVGEFIKRHPTTKILALCFLILIGVALIADGLGFHIPRGYIYFAMAFAALVEAINVWAKRAGNREPAHAAAEGVVYEPNRDPEIKPDMPPPKLAKNQRMPAGGDPRNKGRRKKTRRR
jgi:predicted tellurium resistance membrane protein TerC